MNFKEIESIESLAVLNKTEVTGFRLEIYKEYFEKENRKSRVKDNPFVYFYEDVISGSLSFNFKETLGDAIFKIATDDASACLNICDDFYKLSSWSISGWLQNALKFVDNIVLHFIQEHCKETPKTHLKAGVEKARYIDLSKKNGDISVAGFILIDLYNFRNNFEHRTIIHIDGKQELISPKRNKVRQDVIKLFPDVLKRILKAYKTAYPDS